MPLYVRDERVNQLAQQAQKILKAPTKTDAIRQALERVVETPSETAVREKKASLEERIERLRAKYDMPPYESLEHLDEKAFLDEMWGDNDVHR
ncbi:type II toxin-antitoxin system VapB family antitoxin [Neorhizobium sp. CSC1952]|uniref:type II toxin-antitoxin system VapB family antitoxin n=1 Tax=Neorhizobium sp. CSC1952 TaxID=2978974 RepID=UPI0025A6176F|nr:type II toxin-antitoxin system VapB family antitoxin [Rhizobium sp. CSC1952]WJR67462.1 type II toxin-antitoxin system VapB family antitoxin [Rhizobium sp. CSC1952]